MKEFLKKIDGFLELIISKIPPHIRDLLKKAGLALLAILFLLAVSYGIQLGFRDAIPSGMQLSGSTRELFYLDELKKANEQKQPLFEDVEVDPMVFPSRKTPFATMGKDTQDRLLGEKEEFLKDPDFLRPRQKGPMALEEDIFSPQRLPKDLGELKETEGELLPLKPRVAEAVGQNSEKPKRLNFLE